MPGSVSSGDSCGSVRSLGGATPGRAPARRPWLAPFCTVRCLVFVDDAARKPPVAGYGEAVMFGPGADFPAAVSAGCCPGACAWPPRACRPGVFHERSKLSAEIGGVSCAEVDFVGMAVHAEVYGLICRTPGQVVLKLYFDALHYLPPCCATAAI